MLSLLLLPFKLVIWIILLPFNIIKWIIIGIFNLIAGIFKAIGYILGTLIYLIFALFIFGLGWVLVGAIFTSPIFWIIYAVTFVLAIPYVIFIINLDKKKDQTIFEDTNFPTEVKEEYPTSLPKVEKEVPENDLMTCPHCDEQIKQNAIKCKFCKEFID